MTVKELARLSGVSIGTVDRVLHQRGKVALEQAKSLLTLAGASRCFAVSLLTGEGLEGLKEFIAAAIRPA